MSEHTAEPWAFEGRGDTIAIVDENERTLADVPFRNPDDLDAPETEDFANARRIVACVNACIGISTEALTNGAIAEMRQYVNRCADKDDAAMSIIDKLD